MEQAAGKPTTEGTAKEQQCRADEDLRVGGRVVETVGPEGFFGEMALIDDGPRSVDAVAHTACTLVPVDQKQFHFMVAETAFFALVLLRTFSRRLRRAGTATVPAG